MYDYDEYDDVKAELLAERRAEQRYRGRLMRHPDPRDPDWPGHDAEADAEHRMLHGDDNS